MEKIIISKAGSCLDAGTLRAPGTLGAWPLALVPARLLNSMGFSFSFSPPFFTRYFFLIGSQSAFADSPPVTHRDQGYCCALSLP
jgi:hypothetical protein